MRPVDKSQGLRIKSNFPSGSNSVVECDLAKVEVAGSNPVSRSRFPRFQLASCSVVHRLGTHSIELGRGTQVVRERSAKPLCVGSIPTRASNLSAQFYPYKPQLFSS